MRLPVLVLLVGIMPLSPRATADNPRVDLRGHTGAITHLAFSPDGKFLASASNARGETWIWDIAARRKIRTLVVRGREASDRTFDTRITNRRIEWLTYMPDGKRLAEAAADTPTEGAVRLWDVESGEVARTLVAGSQSIRTLGVTADGKLLAASLRDPQGVSQMIVLLDPEDGKTVRELRSPRLAVTNLAFTPDGTRLISVGSLKATIWDAARGALLHEIAAHKKAIEAIAVFPDGKRFCTAGADDHVRLWNVEGGAMDREIECKQDGLLSVAVSASGKTIVTGGRTNTIKCWDASNGKLRRELFGHIGSVTALAFNADGTRLASGSRDQSISVWEFNAAEIEKEKP